MSDDKTNKAMYGFIGICLLAADFLTKFLTQKQIPLMFGNSYPYRGIGVFKNFFGIEFSLVHATNRGAAWGLFADYQFYLLGLRLLFVTALFSYLFFYNKCQNAGLPLTLISFGALGNIIDYFLYGHVVDMLHFVLWGYDFPVFNVADSAICIGIFWLFLSSLTRQESSR